MTDVIEKAAEVLAGHFGPGWDKLPLDKREQRARLLNQRGGFVPEITKADCLEAAKAAYTAIVGDKVLVDRPDPSPFASSGERSALAHIEINPDTPPPDWAIAHLKRLRTMGFINESMTEATEKGRKALIKRRHA